MENAKKFHLNGTELLKDALKTEQDETARLRRQIEVILEIADTGGRRIETAMDACEKICGLCCSALPSFDENYQDILELRGGF